VLAAFASNTVISAANAATTTKPYSINITTPDPLHPHDVGAGSSTSFTATLVNEANPQSLGSANITAPPGFTVTGASPGNIATVAGNVVQLRNLGIPPGQSVAVTIQATAPCTAGTELWQSQAKQSNDFNGPPGNAFVIDSTNTNLTTTVDGGCQLNFVTQPTDAVVKSTISTSPFNTPPGGPVQVEVLDGNGVRVTSSTVAITLAIGADSPNPAPGALLSGATSVTQNAVTGVASFSTLSVNLHGDYDLSATSPGITSATSNVFSIWDVATACTAGKTCTATINQTNSMSTSASGTSSTDGFLLESLGEGTLTCGDNFHHAPSVTTLSERNFTSLSTKTVVLQIDKTVVQQQGPNNGVSFYQVCYSSGTPFTDRYGNTTTLGLLPDCTSQSPTPPCVASKTKDKAGDVIETLTLPGGDPRFH